MRKRLATALVVLAVLAAACGDDDDAPAVGEGAEDTEKVGAQTLPIRVDAQTTPFATSWVSFFPSKVTARPGDSLEFTAEFTGENHTVTAGTLIDEVLEAEKKAGPPKDGPPPPEVQALLKKLPPAFVEEGEPKPGEEFLAQAGNQPCFSATEDPPTGEPCPKDQQELPEEFTGKARFINTGFMEDEDTFKIKLADDLKTGTYTFVCLIHGADMREEVTVVAKSADIPTAEEVKAAGEKELGDFMGKLKPAADEVLTSLDPKTAKAGAFFEGEEGEEGEKIPNIGINVFPKELPIKKGESVTWEVNGFHNVAFNAPEDARPWILKADDGTVSSNRKAFDPANSPKIPAPPEGEGGGGGGGGEEGPPPQVKVDGGRWDGKGFMSSGILLSFEAQLVYTRTFTEAGTYKYICLVHPDMEGTVKVT